MKNIYQALTVSSLLMMANSAIAFDNGNCSPKIINNTPDSRYEVIGNGEEVKDKQTGLIWQTCLVGEVWDGKACTEVPTLFTWHDALKEAKAKADSTKKPYRVPNIKELFSLISYACTPRMNITYFGVGIDAYDFDPSQWTSSPSMQSKNEAYTFDFIFGNTYTLDKTEQLSLRLVRSE